jgi:hypothetical protein
MIPCFIPSKDRPAQLLLLLESFQKNAIGLFQPIIMFNSSNEDFTSGYRTVLEYTYDWPNKPIWINENECRPETGTAAEEIFYGFLEDKKDDVVCLFSDDCILYRPFTITEKGVKHLFEFDDLFTFTLRLGTNITVQDYVHNTPIEKHPADLMWRWDEIPFRSAFGFATGFDGYFYKAKDLLDLSERKPFGRICFWEKMICEQFEKNPPRHKPLMACPKESKVFVQQVNVTHAYNHNTTGGFNVSLKELNDKLLSSQKIDLESMDFSGVNCTHGEISWGYKSL